MDISGTKGSMGIVIGLMVLLVIGMVFMNILAVPLTNSSTETTSQDFTQASDPDTFALTDEHWYADCTGIAVTNTVGSVACDSVSANRMSVVVSGQSSGTTTVSYVREKEYSSGASLGQTKEFVGIIKIVPLLIALGILGAAFVGIGIGALAATGKSAGGFSFGTGLDVAAFIVLVVGFFLFEAIEGFTESAQLTYENLPEFSGVSSILGIVLIGYILSLVSMAIGGVVGRFRN